jgi:hypothetical protein
MSKVGLKKIIINYMKKDFENLKIFVFLQDFEEIEEDTLIDIDTYLEDLIKEEEKLKEELKRKYVFYNNLKKKYKLENFKSYFKQLILKGKSRIDNLLKKAEVFENSFFFFSGAKSFGFNFLDLELYDEKFFEIINFKYERLLNSKLIFGNSLLQKFHFKIATVKDSKIFYKFKNKKEFLLFFSNLFKLSNNYLMFDKIFKKFGLTFYKEKIKGIRYLSLFKTFINKHPLIFCFEMFKSLKRTKKFDFKLYIIFKQVLQNFRKEQFLNNLKQKDDDDLKDLLLQNKITILNLQQDFNIEDILNNLLVFK